ncbi:hypothetical protein MJO29_001079 [Puccinia striiformis f. sp. tritici]|uniref:Uncharacterized protein n=1 Tax=Puccinia striiformis f. sp. tritici PST-78 TaxID=1165861 RepID=A0A0L0VM17_9BASI|nr:hypothetical protein Pst134EB_002301 [Puccinia striiformis f. sp. tritici]KAI7967802.1 hypothetical protein MJO29_001079 [Puccinia striiformis f. sp. tritici]KNF00324.1 hypothetical protein PSTG_06497 [Puccinia striiformis f. sp. tritici PST-78]
MDSSISFQARTISSSTASLINQEDPEDDSISDPLQQWLLFDPPPIHEEAEEEDEGEGEFQSISHPILHTSMPSHDGTGHFLSPNGSEHGGPSDHPQNITIQSLKSLSEYGEGSSIDDDLLSIPSSLSITRSISSRSVSDFRPQEMDMDHDEAELLITPMAISAGLLHQHQSQSQSQSHSGSGSHRSRDQLRTKRTTSRHSNRTHSRSSRPRSSSSRVLDSPNTSSSSLQKPSVLFINPTSDKQNINHSNTGIIAISFIASVASKILDLDSDTLDLLSHNPYQNHSQTNKNRVDDDDEQRNSVDKKRVRLPVRFSIGELDDQMRIHSTNEKDMINSPMDLSGFIPPSTDSVWRNTNEHEKNHDLDGVNHYHDSSSSTLKVSRSLSSSPRLTNHHQPNILRMSSQLNLPDSAAEDEDEDDSNPFNSISRSSSSLASGLLKKVLDEWTNW